MENMSNFFKARFLEHEFTIKEIAVAMLVIDGEDNKDIAKKMKISLGTTKMHVGNIYKKVGYSDRNKFISDSYKSYLIHHGVVVELSRGKR